MIFTRKPRLCAALGVGTYLMAAVSISDFGPSQVVAQSTEPCTVPLLASTGDPDGLSEPTITVLQGNTWMLPTRPLLLPEFSADRRNRLERIIKTVRSCQPQLVFLQEVFEASTVAVLERSLPGYQVFTSGETDFTGTVNSSGLVTLSRLHLSSVRFHPFAPLPWQAQTIEKLGRKGFLSAVVDEPGFRGTVVNLHLYAYRDTIEEPITRAQLAEVVKFVGSEATVGRKTLVAGDFNMDLADMQASLPGDWGLSMDGPTYDPVGNPYTAVGSNRGSEKQSGHAVPKGVRTIDYLINSARGEVAVQSRVIRDRLMSDHYFLAHRVTLATR